MSEPKENEQPGTSGRGAILPDPERVQKALGNMYLGTPCSNCGSSKVIRAGACGVCTECGNSEGCS